MQVNIEIHQYRGNISGFCRNRWSMAKRCGPAKGPYTADLTNEESFFKALADQHRLRILATISRSGGEVCVCDLTDVLPLLQPTVSHHLRVLKEANLVTSERRGSWVYYRLHPQVEQHFDHVMQKIVGRKARLGKAG